MKYTTIMMMACSSVASGALAMECKVERKAAMFAAGAGTRVVGASSDDQQQSKAAIQVKTAFILYPDQCEWDDALAQQRCFDDSEAIFLTPSFSESMQYKVFKGTPVFCVPGLSRNTLYMFRILCKLAMSRREDEALSFCLGDKMVGHSSEIVDYLALQKKLKEQKGLVEELWQLIQTLKLTKLYFIEKVIQHNKKIADADLQERRSLDVNHGIWQVDTPFDVVANAQRDEMESGTLDERWILHFSANEAALLQPFFSHKMYGYDLPTMRNMKDPIWCKQNNKRPLYYVPLSCLRSILIFHAVGLMIAKISEEELITRLHVIGDECLEGVYELAQTLKVSGLDVVKKYIVQRREAAKKRAEESARLVAALKAKALTAAAEFAAQY